MINRYKQAESEKIYQNIILISKLSLIKKFLELFILYFRSAVELNKHKDKTFQILVKYRIDGNAHVDGSNMNHET